MCYKVISVCVAEGDMLDSVDGTSCIGSFCGDIIDVLFQVSLSSLVIPRNLVVWTCDMLLLSMVISLW